MIEHQRKQVVTRLPNYVTSRVKRYRNNTCVHFRKKRSTSCSPNPKKFGKAILDSYYWSDPENHEGDDGDDNDNVDYQLDSKNFSSYSRKSYTTGNLFLFT